jgi:hypothetical protein
MPPIKSPVCAKGHKWSQHGRVVTLKSGRTRNVCLICTKAYQKQYKRPKK